MSTAITLIAVCAGYTCATALNDHNPNTLEMVQRRHTAMSGLLRATMVLHNMEGNLSTDGLDDTFNLLTTALHDVETLRSWYLFDLAEGHATTVQRKGQA